MYSAPRLMTGAIGSSAAITSVAAAISAPEATTRLAWTRTPPTVARSRPVPERRQVRSAGQVRRGRGLVSLPRRGGTLPQPPDDPADDDCGREDREGDPAPLRAGETVVFRGRSGARGSGGCR